MVRARKEEGLPPHQLTVNQENWGTLRLHEQSNRTGQLELLRAFTYLTKAECKNVEKHDT
jgi:hypothetical protein